MNNNTGAAAVGRRGIAVAAAILAGLAAPGAVVGQPPESVIVDVGACVNLRSPGERLDCYEAQVERARAQPPAAAAPSPAAPSASPGAPATERLDRVENVRVANSETSNGADFEAVITALRETVPNAWVITLDNGQIWSQDYAKAYRLNVGQRVQISRHRGFGGGYRLTVVGMNGFIQVERVR